MRLEIALVAVLVMAGCSGSSGNPPPTTTAPTTTGPAPPTVVPPLDPTVNPFDLRPETTDCDFLALAFAFPKEDVDAWLPEGFEPTGLADPALAAVNLGVFTCSSLIIDNETLVAPFSYAVTVALVSVNDTLDGAAETHFFLLESFASNTTALALFQTFGHPALLGTIDLTLTAQVFETEITVDGSTWYHATGGTGANEGLADTDSERYFWLAEGIPTWLAANHTFTLTNVPSTAITDFQQGFLHAMSPGETGASPPIASFGQSRSQWMFERLA